jgi:hypothetical protein
VDSTTGATNQTVLIQTDDTGCFTFSISDLTPGSTRAITLTEGTLGTDWTQTAPGNGTYDVNGQPTASGPSTVSGATPSSGIPASGGVISVTVSPNDDTAAPNFGNTNPNCPTAQACGGSELTVTKTANPGKTFSWKIAKSVDKTEIDDSTGSATFHYTVVVTPSSNTTGWVVTGDISVTNPTPADVIATITDAVNSGNATCTLTDTNSGQNETILAGTTGKFPYSCTYGTMPTSADTNVATATWPNGQPTGTATIDFSSAVMDNSVAVTDSLGGTLGTVTLNGDNSTSCNQAASGFTGDSGSLNCTGGATANSPATFTYSVTFTGDPAGTCTSHGNTATYTTNSTATTGTASQSVEQCVGKDLSVSKTATPAFTRTYNWGISKNVDKSEIDTSSGAGATFNYSVTASESGYIDSAWVVAGNITISNPNNWEDIPVSVSDALTVSGATCTFSADGTTYAAGPYSAMVNRSTSISPYYKCTYASAPSALSGTNSATADWSGAANPSTPDTSASGTANYDFTKVTPTKVNTTITPTDSFNGGSGVNLCTLTATTTPCTLTAIDTTPYTSQTYTYGRTLTAPTATCASYSNTATTGLTRTGESASQTVKVCGASNLTVSKTAAGSFTSGITKTGPASPVEKAGASTLSYTITVTESGWMVSGKITVTNPNDWEDIPVTLSDALSVTGATCGITGGTSQTVNRSSSITPAYSCTFTAAPSASGTNTAGLTWSATTYHTSSGSASSSAVAYAYGSLTITDAFNNPATPKTLGTIPAPAATTTYTDSYTVTPTPGACTIYPNTATITQTGQSASVSETVCNTSTGALTMGFWKNTNGQGILGGQAKTGVCPSGAWLRGINPFQDIPAGSTCSQVASYVAKVIGAASCTSSTSTCNSMLKAQMSVDGARRVLQHVGPGRQQDRRLQWAGEQYAFARWSRDQRVASVRDGRRQQFVHVQRLVRGCPTGVRHGSSMPGYDGAPDAHVCELQLVSQRKPSFERWRACLVRPEQEPEASLCKGQLRQHQQCDCQYCT